MLNVIAAAAAARSPQFCFTLFQGPSWTAALHAPIAARRPHPRGNSVDSFPVATCGGFGPEPESCVSVVASSPKIVLSVSSADPALVNRASEDMTCRTMHGRHPRHSDCLRTIYQFDAMLPRCWSVGQCIIIEEYFYRTRRHVILS